MAKGERNAAGGAGARRGRPSPADAADKRAKAGGGAAGAARAGGGKPKNLRVMRRSDATTGHGELAELREEANLLTKVRGRAQSPVATLAASLGDVGEGGLSELIPADLKQITREDMARAFIGAARKSEKLGQLGPMVTALSKAMTLMGYDSAPEPPPVVDPEERRRRILEAAKSYGAILPDEPT